MTLRRLFHNLVRRLLHTLVSVLLPSMATLIPSMLTRKEHEARGHKALAEAESYAAKARSAPKRGLLHTTKDEYMAMASRARSRAHEEFAKAKRAAK